MPGVHVQSTGLDDMIAAFERLGRTGTAEAAARMDAHLTEGFAATQAALAPHTKTGRTGASGRVTSSFTGNEWIGTIEYGVEGPEGEHSTGARWLLVGGDDYLESLARTGDQVGAALEDYFRDALEGRSAERS